MSAEVVNLRRVRKARRRSERAEQAAENRVRHGVSRSQRDALATETELAARRLDGHRLDEPAPDGP